MRYLLIVGKTKIPGILRLGRLTRLASKSSLGGVLARFRYRDD